VEQIAIAATRMRGVTRQSIWRQRHGVSVGRRAQIARIWNVRTRPATFGRCVIARSTTHHRAGVGLPVARFAFAGEVVRASCYW